MNKPVQPTRQSRRPFSKSDQQLVEDFRNGTQDGFAKVYNRYRKPVLKMISTRIRNPDVTEELTQEVFLRVFRFKDHFNPEYEFTTWLWTIARNIVSDHLSHSQFDPLAAQVQNDNRPELNDLVCGKACAETILLKKTERKYLLKMLEQLPRLQRKAILLRVLRGFSYDEIARIMKLSLSAVKSLIHRGKISLQLLMESTMSVSIEQIL